jgi:RNA polymerase sigma-70 factor (ECF subfamily)
MAYGTETVRRDGGERAGQPGAGSASLSIPAVAPAEMTGTRDGALHVDVDREERFLQLFLAHQRQIHAFIMALVPSWSDADDLLQEAATVIWSKLDQFVPGTDFLAWALSIARYQVLNFRRKQRRERVRFSDETVQRLADDMATMVRSADARRDALADCLLKLSERDRELIRLRYQPGATVKGVAGGLGRSFQAVYKSLNRIHAQLLACIHLALPAEGIKP